MVFKRTRTKMKDWETYTPDMLNQLDTQALINQFRHKAGCWHSQRQADSLLPKLKEKLTEKEFVTLSIAHNHYKIGEGAGELYAVCTDLNEKYSKIKP